MRDEVINGETNQDEIPTIDETEDSLSDEEIEQTSAASAQPALRGAEGMQVLGEQKASIGNTLALLESERERLRNRISEMQDTGWKDWLGTFANNPDEALADATARVEQVESEIERKESEVACIDRPMARQECESYLVEHRKQALGEFKMQLESELGDLRERLQSLQEERENHMAGTSGEAEGGTGWRDKIAGALPQLLGDVSDEEVEAVKPNVEDIDREIAEASMLAKQQESEVTCVDRRITGENCDSSAVDEYVRSALDSVKEALELDLQGLQVDLTSSQGEQKQLAQLKKFDAERRQIVNEIEETKKAMDRNESELECAELLVAGKDCDTIPDYIRKSMSEKEAAARDMLSRATVATGKGLSSAGQAAGRVVSSVTEATSRALSKMSRGVLDGYNAIVDGAPDMVTRMGQLLILVVIENVVLPVIFLTIVLKCSVPLARGLMRISTTIQEDARNALSAMDKALPSRKG